VLKSMLLITLLWSMSAPLVWAQGTGDDPAGGERPPTELWEEFPLKQPAPGSRERDKQPAAPAVGSEGQAGSDDGSPGTIPLLLGALVALAGVAAAVGVGVGLRRRRSRRAPTRRPSPAQPAGSLKLPAEGWARAPSAAAKPAGGRGADLGVVAKGAGGWRVEPAPAAEAAADRAHEPAPAARAGARPTAPPAPAPEKPAPEREAPDRADKPDGKVPVAPVPTVASTEDGRGAQALPTPASRPSAGQRAVGYASVSAADDLNNAELKVQVRLIQEACQRRGLTLVKIVRDVESHASSDLRRPGLTYALDRLASRDASCLVVSSIERLTRTAANLGALLGWLTECDARLIVIDLDLDTGTEEGRLGARALATVGGLERRKLEERTRKGLEAARHMRRSGRPAVSDLPSLKQRIADMRAQGMTLQAIADTLNAEGVPTLRGGAEWRPSSVQAAAGYKRPRRKGVLQAPAPPRDKRA
jgi:DNA invertase Pin-like site-specific DNA recombinase